MSDNAIKVFWFFEPNLVPAILLLSHICKYELSTENLDEIKQGLTGTSDERDIWFSYRLSGDKNINLRLTRDEENTDIIFVELAFDKILIEQIDLCVFTIENFFIQHHESQSDI